jgi:hypothetical protein
MWPRPDSWNYGLRTLPELSEVQDLRMPQKARELSGSPADPDSPGRSGAVMCDGRTITGLTAPTGLGGPDPHPLGRGPVPPRAAPAEGAGLALPHACGRRPFAGLQPTYQHLMR